MAPTGIVLQDPCCLDLPELLTLANADIDADEMQIVKFTYRHKHKLGHRYGYRYGSKYRYRHRCRYGHRYN